jgi:alkylated DNA repair dioxygenase AlkB
MTGAARALVAETGYRYLPDFLTRANADRLLAALAADGQWRTEEIALFGRRVMVPRLVTWCGDAGVNYRYSGTDHPCDGWLPALGPVRARLDEELAMTAQLALLNRYRDGQDCIGWHTDDERGQGPWVASLSLGAERTFLLREARDRPATRLSLGHGSLLIMSTALRHALPRTRRPVGERINVTFRQCVAAGSA